MLCYNNMCATYNKIQGFLWLLQICFCGRTSDKLGGCCFGLWACVGYWNGKGCYSCSGAGSKYNLTCLIEVMLIFMHIFVPSLFFKHANNSAMFSIIVKAHKMTGEVCAIAIAVTWKDIIKAFTFCGSEIDNNQTLSLQM